MPTLRVLTAGAVALGSLVVTAPAALAASAPVVQPLRDVNINLGMTQRVCVTATGATGYRWRIWTSAKGWTLLAQGGTAYACINFTGEAVRHMGLIEATATNAAGSTVSNKARLRVWGINPSYPAAAGSTVRSGGWQFSVGASNTGTDSDGPFVQAKVTVQRLGSTTLSPAMATDMAYRTAAGVMNDAYPFGCGGATPDYADIPALATGKSGVGYVCGDATATEAKGGLWQVNSYASDTATTPNGTAWYRGA